MEVARAAIKQNGEALKYATDELQVNREVVLEAVTQSGAVLLCANREFRADKEVVLAAVAQKGDLLKLASPKLQADIELILAVIGKGYGLDAQHASQELKEHREFILRSMKQSFWVFAFASARLRHDPELLVIYQRLSLL